MKIKFIREIRKKYGDYIFAGVAGLASYVIILKLVVPTATQSLDNYRKYEDNKKQLEQLVKKRSILQGVSDSTLRLLSEAEAALPTEKDAAGILIAMENLARLTSYTVDNLNFSPGIVSTISAGLDEKKAVPAARTAPDLVTRHNGANFLTVYLDTYGTTAQFLDFISRLQASRRIMDIESIRLEYPADTSEQITANFRITAYYLPAFSNIGQIGSELPNFTLEDEKLLQNLPAMPLMSSSLIGADAAVSVPVAGKTNLFTR